MKLDVADLARLSTLLDQALDVPPAERGAWLAALDAQVAHLGPTLRELLAKDSARDGSDLIDRMPVFTIAAEAAGSASFKAGDAVGPYRLLRELGRGGMGEVWLAERSDGHLKRPVALKLPMLSARRSVLVQRFARERDIVGSLAHPHIARLYDAGLADDGQPYLALEYIEGKPITTFCDEAALDVRARIALLRQVMDAVQYAHANLVVHRDLKPSNVLVTADGKAMLLDFGIAKLLQGDQTEAGATELTQLGGRALTPDYAAPEQLTGAPVSIATDVYALGLLLCESLTGQRAFTATNRSALEHAILNDEPARPSQRRAGALSALRRGAAGELDTIVLKALKKAPAERYPTVNAFADDLDRFVRGEAVLAQPDRLVYRLRKFVTRHRVPVAIGSAVAVALLATSALALVQAIEARRQATTAQQETKRAQAVQAFMTDLFQANTTHQDDPAAAQRVTAR
ncbi:MAG TPA: serine/threonine-protein kinase, partial [Burkholderiaceae bacterium]|nr:serine/threonine-protein kinase [Burkholderiaceae bacterium]